jgi:Leucine-rich repeat (LRR) protein
MSDNSPTTKKRKANDGRATVPDSNHSGGGFLSSWLGYFSSGRRDDNASTTCGSSENLTQKMDAMMQMMSRMEERCSRLETECKSLKTMLKGKMEQDDCKFDSLAKHHEYNTMLVRNQSWEYSVPVHSGEYWIENGYNEDVARYLAESSECLKDFTEAMRQGEFPNDYGNDNMKKGINLDWSEEDPILDYNVSLKMYPHWREFISALKQFTPVFGVLPDGCETYFELENIQLGFEAPKLLKDALMNKPFQKLSFVNKTGVGDNEGMSVDSVMDIVESNKHIRKLTIGNNRIEIGHIIKICSAVCRGSIVELDLKNCFENGLGDAMMISLLTNCGSKLQRLGFASNRITSSTTTLLADFLATNSLLKELDLSNDGLSGDCVILLANALRSNTTLRSLDLSGNSISDAGKESLRLVLCNDSSLNSIADSNHSCSVHTYFGSFPWNVYRLWKNGARHEVPESFNRSRKIYRLLSERNKSISMSNVQHFDDIDVKMLPSMLKAFQRYASVAHLDDTNSPPDYCRVEPLSIVYEVMRKWDKVFPLYTD